MKIAIIGAGPAGLFCALRLLDKGIPGKSIHIFEQGFPFGKRKNARCIRNCDKCNYGVFQDYIVVGERKYPIYIKCPKCKGYGLLNWIKKIKGY